MKKASLPFVILLVTLTLGFFGPLRANPVDPTTAKKAASLFLRCLDPSKSAADLTDITSKTPLNGLYVFTIGKEGFIVISGDDNTEPVLVYSLENNFPEGIMPAHIRSWYQGYEQLVASNSLSDSKECSTAHEKWQMLLDGKMPSASKDIVPKMLTTTWNQSPYYNQLVPYDSTLRQRPPCGCTATATAQIMKYFNHPVTGYGSELFHHYRFGDLFADYGATTYDWDNMPKSLNDNSNETQIDAVSTLIYHVGIAVHMNYKVGGSAGKTACYGYGGEASSENAFKYNFRYSPYVWTAFRIDYTIDQWKELMLNELEHNRPILYAGYDEEQAGHAFVLDGYNANLNKFHFNWGWGGQYDGYYYLDNLNPSSTTHGPTNYHFDLFATATIGIEPYDEWSEESQTTVVTSVEPLRGASANDGTVTGAGTYQFGDTITLTATATNENSRFLQWSDGCRYNPRVTVATGGTVNFTAQFVPVQSNLVRYHTCDNAMNRASNVPEGLGCDSVWGIKIPASAIAQGSILNAIRFMGRKAGTHTLTIFSGTDAPEQTIYSATFFDSLDYAYTFYQHDLSSPIAVDNTKSLWVMLKCTDVDTPAVFSIYGGNPNSILVGEQLTSRADDWKFSWMIEALFDGNSTADINMVTTDQQIEFFPNPATDQVTITVSELSGKASLQLVDLNGRTCLSRQITCDGSTTMQIATAGLAKGVYLVRLTSDTATSVRRLVIK